MPMRFPSVVYRIAHYSLWYTAVNNVRRRIPVLYRADTNRSIWWLWVRRLGGEPLLHCTQRLIRSMQESQPDSVPIKDITAARSALGHQGNLECAYQHLTII